MIRLLCLLFIAGVSATAAVPPGVKIKGHIQLSRPVEWIYLTYRTTDGSVYDSARIENGTFRLEEKITEPTLGNLWIYLEREEGKRPKQDKVPVFMEPGEIEISIKDSLRSAKITGSKAQEDYLEFSQELKPYLVKKSALMRQMNESNKAGDKETTKKIEGDIDAVDDDISEKVCRPYILMHPASPIALTVLQQYAGDWYNITMTKVEKVDALLATLPAAAKETPSGKNLAHQIEAAKSYDVGKYAVDFVQNDTSGKAVTLSSFKGKYVLLDFWASWCGPCRAENPNVVKAFNAYKDKGFTVLSVSLDQPGKRQAWLDAIHKDGLAWTHVSDLQYWNNAVAKQYNITAIPQNFLLDPTGKIIAKNIGGEELAQKLGEVIK